MKKSIFVTIVFFFFFSLYGQNDAIAKRENFVEHSKTYLGVPYVWGGTTTSGMDCSGFVYMAARNGIKLQLPRSAKAMSAKSTKIEKDDLEKGDLLFFKTNTDPNISHVGIYLGNNEFIHCASSGSKTGVIISSVAENYWAENFISAGQILPSAKIQNTTEIAKKTSEHINSTKIAEKPKNSDFLKSEKTAESEKKVAVFKKPPNINNLSGKEKRKIFTDACLSCIATPYKIDGTSKNGVDASGFIFAIARDLFGMETFPRTVGALFLYAHRIKESSAQPGDIIFFHKNGQIYHAGVFLGKGKFIHSFDSQIKPGVQISTLKDEPFKSEYHSIAKIFSE
ncbi:MAG: C40 family peptidase [Treponema sp.]|nr:C40 family peptidase [Treponema sp.]